VAEFEERRIKCELFCMPSPPATCKPVVWKTPVPLEWFGFTSGGTLHLPVFVIFIIIPGMLATMHFRIYCLSVYRLLVMM
jgi:hypothetical protein